MLCAAAPGPGGAYFRSRFLTVSYQNSEFCGCIFGNQVVLRSKDRAQACSKAPAVLGVCEQLHPAIHGNAQKIRLTVN